VTSVPHIYVMGYLSIDTISMAGQTLADVPGGAALYAALGARAAGGTVSIMACAGEDYPPRWLDQITALGIDTSRIRHKSGPTRRAQISHIAGGGRVSAHHDQAGWWERTLALAPELPDGLDADYLVLAPMPPELAMRACTSANCQIIADTSAAFARLDPQTLMSLVPRLSCFAPSLEESRILLPGLSDHASLRHLAATGAHIVQKRGARGMAVCAARQGLIRLVRAPATAEADPTGAGDATVGALAVGLAKGLPLFAAAEHAAAIGARAVSGHGPSALGFAWHDTSGGLPS
jgi:ribokinase